MSSKQVEAVVSPSTSLASIVENYLVSKSATYNDLLVLKKKVSYSSLAVHSEEQYAELSYVGMVKSSR